MSFVAIIPARMKSTRLPNKPLMDIGGAPMVVRVAQKALAAGADLVAVATDHADIVRACEACGVKALMTSPEHPTGTDRLSQAASMLGLEPDTIVVNVQGDEPLIDPAVIRRVADVLQNNSDCAIATAAHRIYDIESFRNPNVVKVVLDQAGRAMTFSRAPIPWPRDAWRNDPEKLPEGFCALHHIGLYAYRASFLAKFPTLAQSPIESLESLEQLRAMWYGYRIAVTVLEENLPAGVDTAEDLERVRNVWARSQGAD